MVDPASPGVSITPLDTLAYDKHELQHRQYNVSSGVCYQIPELVKKVAGYAGAEVEAEAECREDERQCGRATHIRSSWPGWRRWD